MILTMTKYHENLLRDSPLSLLFIVKMFSSLETKMVLKTPNETFLRITRYQIKPFKESPDTFLKIRIKNGFYGISVMMVTMVIDRGQKIMIYLIRVYNRYVKEMEGRYQTMQWIVRMWVKVTTL